MYICVLNIIVYTLRYNKATPKLNTCLILGYAHMWSDIVICNALSGSSSQVPFCAYWWKSNVLCSMGMPCIYCAS